MPQTTVRITSETLATLRSLAAREGRSLQAVLADAIERYRRAAFLEATNAAFAAERSDARGWAALQEERARYEGVLADGLAGEPPWPDAPPRRSPGRRSRRR